MSGLALPNRGDVIRYDFLWPGEAEPEKRRPCAVAVAMANGRVMVLPITHSAPSPEQAHTHIFVPDAEKQHIALDADPQWIVIDAINYFTWPSPEVARTRDGSTFTLGTFSEPFFIEVLNKVMELRKEQPVDTIRR